MISADKLLRVNEVAEILRVSQMTVIRWCNSGHLPCVKIGVSRRIKESDLNCILNSERGPQKLKAPVSKRPVYVGPPADECGFEDNKEEWQKEMNNLCAKAKTEIEVMKAVKASAVKTPEPVVSDFKGQSTGKFPSGFDTLFEAQEK